MALLDYSVLFEHVVVDFKFSCFNKSKYLLYKGSFLNACDHSEI